MPKKRDSLRPWVEDYLRIRYPELEAPLLAAVDAFDTVQTSGILLPEQLESIKRAASSSRGPLYETGTGLLEELSQKWPEAGAVVLAMSRSKRAQVRFNAILSIGSLTPLDVADQVLQNGLIDKSVRVRVKAADWILRLRKSSLIPNLIAVLATEKDLRASSGIELTLRLLRDGYMIKVGPDENYWVTLLTKTGSCSHFVNRKQLEENGVDAVIKSLQDSLRKRENGF